MALYRCGGGGTLKETVLWTNSSPGSSMASGATMSLSESIANFDYIKIQYRYYTGSTVTYETGLVKSTDIQATGSGYSYPQARYFVISIRKDSSTNAYFRNITRDSNTQFQASSCYVFAGTTTFNSYCIPYKIIGVKLV